MNAEDSYKSPPVGAAAMQVESASGGLEQFGQSGGVTTDVAKDFPERRPIRNAFCTLLVLLVVTVGAGFLVLWRMSDLPPKTFSFNRTATDIGRGASEELGAALAVIIPVQLGILVAIAGSQIFAKSARDEVDIRSALSTLAALPGLAIAPAVAFSVYSAFFVNGVTGRLMVILPLYAIQFGAAVFIRTFELGSRRVRRDVAESQLKDAVKAVALMRTMPRYGDRRWASLLVLNGIPLTLLFTWLLTLIPSVVSFAWEWHRGGIDDVYCRLLLCLLTMIALALAYCALILLLVALNAALKPLREASEIFLIGIYVLLILLSLLVFAITTLSELRFLGIGILLSTTYVVAIAIVAIVDGGRVCRIAGLGNHVNRSSGGTARPCWEGKWGLCGGSVAMAGSSWALAGALKNKRFFGEKVERLK